MHVWIAGNPPGRGEGWHPYPLSTRVGNWIAAISLEPSLSTSIVEDSLRRQLAFLERNVELGILGNHLVRNARALALGATAFDDPRLAAISRALLRRELPEQVLADGGHYERSPVYHLIVLRDLLEIRAATETTDLDAAIEGMSRFGACLARPDRAPALFNDGGLDLAPDLGEVLPDPPTDLSVFPETGYVVVRSPERWLAFDCGPPGPRYLPAHAHADVLSFQLWSHGRSIVADPGTYSYEGAEREWFRSSPAHATIAIDAQSQFVFWGAFRAGLLPRVELHDASGDGVSGSATASLTGFPGIRGAGRHCRTIRWARDGSVTIEDEVAARGRRRVVSTIPLAPGLDPGEVGAACDGASVTIEQRPVSERFYERTIAAALVGEVEAALPRELGWRLAPTAPAR